MISEVIKGLTTGKIKQTKSNVFAFGLEQYPKTIKQAWEQFKTEIWLKR